MSNGWNPYGPQQYVQGMSYNVPAVAPNNGNYYMSEYCGMVPKKKKSKKDKIIVQTAACCTVAVIVGVGVGLAAGYSAGKKHRKHDNDRMDGMICGV